MCPPRSLRDCSRNSYRYWHTTGAIRLLAGKSAGKKQKCASATVRPGERRARREEGSARIRIGLGQSLMASPSSLSRSHRPGRSERFRVCHRRGNGQLDLCTGVEPTGDSQLAPHTFGALLHASQTEMSGPPAFSKNLLIDALSVVQDPQPKLPPFIDDFHFDPPGLSMKECIAHRLACNPVHVVADERSEIPGCAFHLHAKLGAILAAMTGSELFSERADRPGQVVGNHRGGAQPLHRIPALDDRLPRLRDDGLQLFPGFRRILDSVYHSGKLHQHALKTLQQGIVEIPRDARPLVDAFFHTQVELLFQIPEP